MESPWIGKSLLAIRSVAVLGRSLGPAGEAILSPMLISCRRGRLPSAFAVWLLVLGLTSGLSACRQGPALDGDLDYHRGRNALAMGRYDWARFYFAADLEAHPERAASLRGLGLGWISGYQGSLSHGIDAFERYLQLVPEDDEIRLRVARSWLRSGELERAQEILDGVAPSLDKQILRTRILLAREPETARLPIEAILQETVQRSDVHHSDVHHLAAQIYARLGEEDKALTQARRAAELDPLNAEVVYLTAQILRRQGAVEAAGEALATFELLNRLPGPGSPMDARQELAVLRQVQERLQPSSLAFQKRLARLLLETGDIAAATPLLEEMQAAPDDRESWLGLAQAAHSQGMAALAGDLYRQILEHDPEHLKALGRRALLAYETQDLATARQLLDRGLELDPHDASLHYTRGLLALVEEDDDAAVEAFRRAVDLVPWLARYRITLADVYLTLGDREAFDQLLAETPAPDPEIDAYRKKHP